MKLLDFIRKALSDQGEPSSKRCLGFILIAMFVACTIYLVIKDGATEVTKSLLETGLIGGCSLLGISIFDKNKHKEE